MTLFKFLWLRRFIRKNTNPIPINKAEVWKKRLSFTYLLLAWNAFGLVCYMCYTGKADWAKYYGIKSEMEANMPSGNYCSCTSIMITIFTLSFYYRTIVGANVGTEKSNSVSDQRCSP